MRPLLSLIPACFIACSTTATEAPPSRILPSLSASHALAPKKPKQPVTHRAPSVPRTSCLGKPDISVNQPWVRRTLVGGWVQICVGVSNQGSGPWLGSNRAVPDFRSDKALRPGRGGAYTAGMAQGVLRCGWVRVPDFKRLGNETINAGECRKTMSLEVTLKFSRDADETHPGDCNSKNDSNRAVAAYTARC